MSVKKVHVVIFDIDGCLADDRHRRYLLPKKGQDGTQTHDAYAEYNGAAAMDKVHSMGQAVFRACASEQYAGGHIAFLTARPEYMREVTANWLRDNLGLPQLIRDSFIIMRPEGNMMTSPELKKAQLNWLEDQLDILYRGQHIQMIVKHAYDDRRDVLQMYHECGIPCTQLEVGQANPWRYTGEEPATTGRSAAEFGAGVNEIMRDALATFESRNGDYSYNAEKVEHVMKALFPHGVTLKNPGDFHMFHLFELLIVKITRFANSGLTHTDSMRDAGVYSFMCENLTKDHAITIHKATKENKQ